MSDGLMFGIIFGGVWCMVGAIFLAVGLGVRRSWLRREDRLRGRAEGTVLEVIRHDSHSSNGTSTSWNPLVEFDYEGRRISLEAKDGASRKQYFEGQRVNVLYDPDDPASFRVEGEETGRTLYRVFTTVGAVCLAIAILTGLIVLATDPFVTWWVKYRILS